MGGFNFREQEKKAGAYRACVQRGIFRESAKGTPLLELRFIESTTGKEIARDYLPQEGAGVGMSRKKLKALGFDTDDEDFEVTEDDLRGREVTLHLVVSPYTGKDGKTYTNLKPDASRADLGYEPIDGASVEAPPEDDVPF